MKMILMKEMILMKVVMKWNNDINDNEEILILLLMIILICIINVNYYY